MNGMENWKEKNLTKRKTGKKIQKYIDGKKIEMLKRRKNEN
jgi:hypothetical protein